MRFARIAASSGSAHDGQQSISNAFQEYLLAMPTSNQCLLATGIDQSMSAC